MTAPEEQNITRNITTKRINSRGAAKRKITRVIHQASMKAFRNAHLSELRHALRNISKS